VSAGAILLALRPLRITGYANMLLRYRTWWLIVLVFGGGMVAHPVTAWVLVCVLSGWAWREYRRLVPTAVGSSLPWVGYGAALILPTSASLGGGSALQSALGVCLLAALIGAVLEGDPTASSARIGSTLLGIVLLPWALSHLLVLRAAPDGVALVLALSLLTGCNDVFAYVAGRLWGKRRLAPRISPNKTVAGWLGSGVATLVLAGLLHRWIALPLGHALALGAVVACLGVVGDLAISLLKRDGQVKDSGQSLPGHGGLLDRLDSLLLVAPVSVMLLERLPTVTP
jgi:phosphatidate cytidylyltransferase